jgi:hypothetical protein
VFQDEFFQFEQKFTGNEPLEGPKRFVWQRTFATQEGFSLSVNCINTAWMSQIKELQGQLYVPPPVFSELGRGSENQLIVSVFHHPYKWFEVNNSREFLRAIEANSDLVITGHEHSSDVYTKDRSEEISTYVEGGALHDPDFDSEFAIIKVDSIAKKQTVVRFRWQTDLYTQSTQLEKPLVRNPAILAGRLESTDGFRHFLDDPGIGFTHPRKTTLSLSNLYVYPDLRLRSLGRKSTETVPGDQLISFIHSKERILVAGPTFSGKTALAKTLYSDLRMIGAIPILLSGSDLKNPSPAAFERDVRTACELQYGPDSYERFRQCSSDKKILLVDDWEKATINSQGREAFYENANLHLRQLIFFTSDLFTLPSEITSLSNTRDVAFCEIKEFGYQLRDQLITKWCRLGQEFTIDEIELAHEISTNSNRIETLIGKGIMPSYPMFVLAALQERDSSSLISTQYGSYGHVYDSLITSRLITSAKRATDIGTWYAYLGLLAYALYKQGSATIEESPLRLVHQEYVTTYGRELDFPKMLEHFVRSQILENEGPSFSFKYKYYYYFFLAKYFQDAIANEANPIAGEMRQELQSLADRVSLDEYSHILSFYLYLTKDRVLIQHILDNAKHIFEECAPATFSNDVAMFNTAWKTTPPLPAPSSDPHSNRRRYLREKDEAIDDSDSDDHEPSLGPPVPYERSLAFGIKIAFAMNSIDVMGQILRNFPGDLRKDLKLELAANTVELGLRTTRAIFDLFFGNAEGLRNEVIRSLATHQAYKGNSDQKLKSTADQLITTFALVAAYGMIKKISRATGLEELDSTYGELRTRYGEDNLATRLVDLAIRFDHFGTVPVNDARDLEGRVKKNLFAYMMLRQLVYDYLYLFPVEHKTRQKLTGIFELGSSPQLVGGSHKKTRRSRSRTEAHS